MPPAARLAKTLAALGCSAGQGFHFARPLAADEALQDLPVLAVHGLYDQVIPIRHGRALRDRLARLPVALTYREYEMAHEVTADTISDIAGWLTACLDRSGLRRADG